MDGSEGELPPWCPEAQPRLVNNWQDFCLWIDPCYAFNSFSEKLNGRLAMLGFAGVMIPARENRRKRYLTRPCGSSQRWQLQHLQKFILQTSADHIVLIVRIYQVLVVRQNKMNLLLDQTLADMGICQCTQI
eukprot:g46273.t1